MFLFGTWHPRILEVIHRREREWDESVGLSARRYGNDLIVTEVKARCITPHLRWVQVYGHPAETNLGPASTAENPYRYLQLQT